jgi:hypothetical protein
MLNLGPRPPSLLHLTRADLIQPYAGDTVGNEKLGGLKFLQLLGIDLGPWRSMSIFILNVPFSIEKCISVSALSSKMNRRLVCK